MNRNDDWGLDNDELEYPVTRQTPSNPRVSRSESQTERPTRPRSSGEKPTSSSERPSRPRSSGERPTSSGERPTRSRSEGERPTRSRSEGERSTRSRSEGERPTRPRSDGERPTRPRSDGERPTRPRSDGERPTRPRSDGERPTRSRSDGEKPTSSTSLEERPSRSLNEVSMRPETPASPASKEYLDNLQADSIARNASRGSSDDILAEIKYDFNQIDTNQDLHFKKDDEKFKVNIGSDLRKIPNYIPSGDKESSGLSIFAKVMFGVIIVAISVAISITIIYCGSNVLGLGTPNADYIVEIDLNSDMEQVSKTLESQGVVPSAFLFKTYVDLIVGKGDDAPIVQYGTYLLNSSMSYDEMIAELCQYSATVREVSVMFKEGITIYQMSKLLQENGVCSAADFISTIQEVDFGYDFLINDTDNKYLFHNKEGYMFPDTYMFYIGDDPVNVGKKMIQNYNYRVMDLIESSLPSTNLTQHELMTIASIVQLEAPDIENMKKVASVYLNRINNPGEYSQLQADPTKEYANELKLQMAIIDQEIIDAYNTYAGIGLPPGPVCNPGLDAIVAVLEPADTDYFYFCTNLTTGEFYFATNLEDHNKNVYNAGLRQ